MKRLLCILAAALTSTGSHAQLSKKTLADEFGSDVECISVFSVAPPTGYAPLRIRATNNASADSTVTISATSQASNQWGSSHQLESDFSLAATAGKTTERDFLVPVCADVSPSAWGGDASLSLRVVMGGRTNGVHVPGGGHRDHPFTGFSRALAAKSIGDLNAHHSSSTSSGYSRSAEAFAAVYDSAMLPADWRGFSGLDVLAITSDEWMALQPGVRTAALQWVKLGGVLELFRKSGAPDLASMGVHADSERRIGRGSVVDTLWDGEQLRGSDAAKYTESFAGNRRKVLTDSLQSADRPGYAGVRTFSDNTPLLKELGEKNFAAWQVGIILLIFGIMVGPVNLFYFARAGRRHRLFYTTPVISLAAAALLMVVIFFQDGTGGRGHRASVVYLDAAENSAFIHQYQVSRTGVLFGGSFTMEEPAAVNMALLPESRWTRLKPGNDPRSGYYRRPVNSEPQRYKATDKTLAGDWFQSRSEQAQIIDSVQSTRGRIELKAGSPAVVTSTFTAPLGRLFYVDTTGKYWMSPGEITTGSSVTLTECTDRDFAAWRNEAVAWLPQDEREKLNAAARPGFFYATSKDPGAGMVQTLPSINWESSHIFLFGPLKTS